MNFDPRLLTASRRTFLRGSLAGLGAFAVNGLLSPQLFGAPEPKWNGVIPAPTT